MRFAPEAFPREAFGPWAKVLFEKQSSEVDPLKKWRDFLISEGRSLKSDIVYLPIQFFKTSDVYDFSQPAEAVFCSSGTTGSQVSRHFIASLAWYRQVVLAGFERVLGPPQQYAFLFLLPGYLERPHASLVQMARFLHEASTETHQAFFKRDFVGLSAQIENLSKNGKPILLLGATYALLEWSEKFQGYYPQLTIMETGGMKRQGKEISKEELYDRLKKAFPASRILSEFGMTELHSQAYALSEGLFHCPPWMRVMVQEADDPLGPALATGEGRLLITDLANLHSCAFIATEDLGRVYEDGRFKVLGRLADADVRGCHLMPLG